MPEYSLTSLIHSAKSRVRVRRMMSFKLYEVTVNPPARPAYTIQNLTYYEAQQRLHKERLLIALELLDIPPSKVDEYLKKLEDEYTDRIHKFEDDLKWLNNTVNFNLVTTRRSANVKSRRS